MDDLTLRILVLAVWLIAAGVLIRSLYVTRRSGEANAVASDASETNASDREEAFSLCYQKCVRDYLGYGDQEYCSRLCSP